MQRLLKLNAMPGTAEEPVKERVLLKTITSLDEAERFFYILKAYIEVSEPVSVEIWKEVDNVG